MSLTDKVWSPYVAGAIIGLLQIPTFLLMDTALAEKGEKVGFHQLLGVPFWTAAVAFAVLLAAALWVVENRQSWRSETGADYDGLMEPRGVQMRPVDAHLKST
jgi:membrane protein implicated in regulation of membrane protease activity